jgi:hypothetical protein
MAHTLHLNQSSEDVLRSLVKALNRRELQVVASFNLRQARAQQVDCPCPYHETADCSCQYIVLLVFAPKRPSEGYRTITLHGRDGQVWLSLLESPFPPAGTSLEAVLLNILLGLTGPDRSAIADTMLPMDTGDSFNQNTEGGDTNG